MPLPAAHPYCFLCANSSAHLACTKHIREWIQLEASQGKKKKRNKKKAVKMGPSWLPLPELLQCYCASGGGKTQTVLLAGACMYLILKQLHNHRL